jgi:uncharacterized protein (TIGR02145 family)
MKYTRKVLYGLLFLLIPFMTTDSVLRAAEKDIAGHTISSVSIDGQVWMQENLDVSRYRNGDKIRYAATNQDWLDAAAKGEGAWSYYKNDAGSAGKYGRLYNWYAVHDPRGLAPSGWNIPTSEELNKLATALGSKPVGGGKLKSAESSLEISPNYAADNSGRFCALPGGMRGTGGDFMLMGNNAFFWSSSESTSLISWYTIVGYHPPIVVQSTEHKADGMSVRCIRI